MSPRQQADVRDDIDDALRRLGPRLFDLLLEEADDDAPANVVLGDWVVVVDLIDSDDPNFHWYRQFGSPGMSPHAQTGLLYETLNEQ